MKNSKPFTVSITDKGSKRALPAIWYGGRAGQWFNVVRSKQWPSVYEVINGKHTGMLIDPKDCEKITILLSSDKNDERSVATEDASSNVDDTIEKENYEYERGNE